MEIRDKKFLVIGGAGFIGSHTVDLLVQEGAARVVVFDNFTRGTRENLKDALKSERVEIFPLGGDICYPDLLQEAMNGIDGVFHFAALWLLHCHDFPKSAFDVNIRGTFNILQAVLQSKVKRVVFSSSASVYGDALELPMTEEHPLANQTFYGATKIAGEQMYRSLYQRYRETEQRFDYVGLRYMNVYGPRQDDRGAYVSVIMKMLARIDEGKAPIIHGDGSATYDFVHVRDCARANIQAMKSDRADEFYNVGRGEGTSLKELAGLILELTGTNLEIEFQNRQERFVKHRVGSIEKAQSNIGFTAATSLRDGLKDVIEWQRSQNGKAN